MNRQRGALIFITPMIMVTIILLGVLALDSARLYSLRQEMQSQVNVAAMAAAGEVQTCGGQSVQASTIESAAQNAAERQGLPDDAILQVDHGLMSDLDGDGEVDFKLVSSIEKSNAALVSYSRKERISMLLPQSAFGTMTVTVNAAARKEVVGIFSAAGSTATVNEGLLGGLLGAILNDDKYTLDPTNVESLRGTTVQLGELLKAARVADIAGLLSLDGSRLAAVLRDVADSTSPVGKSLDDLLAASGIKTIQVSDILEVMEGTSVPAGAEFPLYDMIISLVLNVAKTQQDAKGGFLDLPLNLDIDLGPVADVKAGVKIHVGKPPKVVVGPARRGDDGEWLTYFYAPDIDLLVNANVSLLSFGALLTGAEVVLPLAVNVGGAKGAFVGARCALGTNNDVEIIVDIERSVARLGTGSIDPNSGVINPKPAKLQVLGLLSIPLLETEVAIDGEVKGMTRDDLVLTPGYPLYCDATYGCAQEEDADTGGGIDGMYLDVELTNTELLGSLPLKLGPLLDIVEGLLSQVVEGLAQIVINPLLHGLGVGLGGVSVTISGADQSNVQLIENVQVQSSE